MGKQFLFLIAIMLSFVLGQAAGIEFDELASKDQQTERFNINVGQQVTRTITLSFELFDFVIPTPDPNPDELMLNSNGYNSGMVKSALNADDYSLLITGIDSEMFSAKITQVMGHVSVTSGTESVSVKVEVTYSPTEEGPHEATLNILDSSGDICISRNLLGETTPLPGDVNSDGVVDITDITSVIDIVLGNVFEGNYLNADVNGDGTVDIDDVTELTDMVLGKPINKRVTYLLVTNTDGATEEFLIDEKAKVTIDNGKLRIKISTGGRPRSFSLDSLSQLRYEERIISTGNTIASEYMIEADSQTLKTVEP